MLVNWWNLQALKPFVYLEWTLTCMERRKRTLSRSSLRMAVCKKFRPRVSYCPAANGSIWNRVNSTNHFLTTVSKSWTIFQVEIVFFESKIVQVLGTVTEKHWFVKLVPEVSVSRQRCSWRSLQPRTEKVRTCPWSLNRVRIDPTRLRWWLDDCSRLRGEGPSYPQHPVIVNR